MYPTTMNGLCGRYEYYVSEMSLMMNVLILISIKQMQLFLTSVLCCSLLLSS